MDKKPCLAILNITSWSGLCADAEHVYGTLVICTDPEVTIDNVEEYSVSCCRLKHELYKEITFAQAKLLDEKDGGVHFRRAWKAGNKRTTRFNEFAEVECVAIEKWKELSLDCPFISLYHGEKYDGTIILMPGDLK